MAFNQYQQHYNSITPTLDPHPKLKNRTNMAHPKIHIQSTPPPNPPTYFYIFAYNLDSIHLIHNHLRQPSSQHKHPYKLLIQVIYLRLSHHTHPFTSKRSCIHSNILGNETANKIAKFGVETPPQNTTTPTHTAHTTPFWHFKILTEYPHTTPIRHLKPYIRKEYTRPLMATILLQYPYIAK
jgi:hypothetical protein